MSTIYFFLFFLQQIHVNCFHAWTLVAAFKIGIPLNVCVLNNMPGVCAGKRVTPYFNLHNTKIQIGIVNKVKYKPLRLKNNYAEFFFWQSKKKIDWWMCHIRDSVQFKVNILFDFHFSVDCASNPCKNAASCFMISGLFSCSCPSGFTGTLCDQIFPWCVTKPAGIFNKF